MLTGTVLVVEHDAHLRTLLTMPLIASGLHLHEAADHDEAMAIVQADPSIQCVILGSHLPVKTMATVAQNIRDQQPDEIIIFAQFCESTMAEDMTQMSGLIDDFCVDRSSLVELRERLRRSLASLAERRRFRKLRAITERQSVIDPSTGLLTRRRITEHLSQEVSRSCRSGRPLSLLMVRLDEGTPNGASEHVCGDQKFFDLASVIAESVRQYDMCGRVGDRLVMVILPETGFDELQTAAFRLKGEIETSARLNEHQNMTSVAIGGVFAVPAPKSQAQVLIKAAEDALLAAENDAQGVSLLNLSKAAAATAIATTPNNQT